MLLGLSFPLRRPYFCEINRVATSWGMFRGTGRPTTTFKWTERASLGYSFDFDTICRDVASALDRCTLGVSDAAPVKIILGACSLYALL